MTDVVMVKLGGSLITDKRGEASPRTDVMARLGSEIAAALPKMADKLILGHGSGSFGHTAAARSGIGRGPLTRAAAEGVAETKIQAAELHRLLVSHLSEAGLAPFSWAPSSALVMRAGKPAKGIVEPLLRALDFGLLPVTYGDVVMDWTWGASICSTEQALSYLAGRLRRRGLRVKRILWLGATTGLYDQQGATIPLVDGSSHASARRMVGATAGTDVTGGMLLRLDTARRLARRGIESLIVDGRTPGLLTAGLLGETVPGTRYVADL